MDISLILGTNVDGDYSNASIYYLLMHVIKYDHRYLNKRRLGFKLAFNERMGNKSTPVEFGAHWLTCLILFSGQQRHLVALLL